MTYTDVNKIDISLNERLDTLEFYKDELDMLGNRLIEVASKNTNSDVQRNVEHFQNQFEIQRQNISDLQHRVRSNIHICAEDAKFHNGKISTNVVTSISSLDKEIGLFEEEMKNLRDQYRSFLSQWM